MFDHLKRKAEVVFLLILLFTLVLSGCYPKQKEITGEEDEKDVPKKEQKEKSLLPPIKKIVGEFVQIAGWLDDDKIAYISKTEKGYQLYSYNLFAGTYTKLFQSKSEMVNVKISPNLNQILIYTAASDDTGEITIIDKNGNALFTTSLASYDADFLWNPFNENELLVSAFTDEWKSKVSLLSIHQKQLLPLKNINPFSQWLNKEELAYLDWEKDDASFEAPIKAKNVQTNHEVDYNLSNVFSMHVFKEAVVAISTDSNDIDTAVYSFYQHDFRKNSSFSAPHLSKYTDWLIPYFDLHNTSFYTFIPKESGSADTYNSGFDFMSINTKTGTKKQVVKQPLENQPIQLSPKSDWCLYGYYLEQIINVKTGEIFSLTSV
ncbi:MAG: hypothetical protein ABF649_00105 [Bacillus sp. (in: firmicutes)]